MALCMILGAFLIYCGQSMDGGFVPDAAAQQQCTPAPPVFTKLDEADLPANTASNPIAVGAYREVVVYIAAGCSNASTIGAQFRPDAATPFGFSGQFVSTSPPYGGRLRVDGVDLKLMGNGCAAHYVVAGVQ
jgi:hypothetical protein